MSIVYMDQWVFINLLRCHKGQEPEYTKFRDATRKVIETSNNRKHSFPFSLAHLQETLKRTKLSSRKDLYKFIFETSKFNTIRPWTQILDLEVRNAVLKFAGRKPVNLNNFVFGDEIGHCFGAKGEIKAISPNEKVPNEIIEKFKSTYWDSEFWSDILCKDKMIKTVKEIAQIDQDLASKVEHLRKKDYSHPDKRIREKISHVRFLTEVIQDHFIKAVGDLDLDFKKFTQHVFRSEKHALVFMQSIPTAYVFHFLNDSRNMNFSRSIKANDFWDLSALAIAIPYCDIVVTEREWSNILNQKKIGELYNTKIIHDIGKLNNML